MCSLDASPLLCLDALLGLVSFDQVQSFNVKTRDNYTGKMALSFTRNDSSSSDDSDDDVRMVQNHNMLYLEDLDAQKYYFAGSSAPIPSGDEYIRILPD